MPSAERPLEEATTTSTAHLPPSQTSMLPWCQGNQGPMKVQEALPEADVFIFLAHVIGQNGHYDSFRSQE
ncbi:hypothetical protein HZ326_8429 [Fusarium oxysporum f. sp. albedinis]|nr:hypothetical protein HZ326_8429 [Fusarium oxysporum f. sp. albedinis]